VMPPFPRERSIPIPGARAIGFSGHGQPDHDVTELSLPPQIPGENCPIHGWGTLCALSRLDASVADR
jgi:hypothetical protein